MAFLSYVRTSLQTFSLCSSVSLTRLCCAVAWLVVSCMLLIRSEVFQEHLCCDLGSVSVGTLVAGVGFVDLSRQRGLAASISVANVY